MWPDPVISRISEFLDPTSCVSFHKFVGKPLVVHQLTLSYVDTATYRDVYAFNTIRSLNLTGSRVHPDILTSRYLTELNLSQTNVNTQVLTTLLPLTKLHLNQVRLDSVEFVTQFKETLIELSLDRVKCDLTPLTALTELRSLVVSTDDLSFMRNLVQLTSLSVISSPNSIDISPLYYLPLQSVTLGYLEQDAVERLAQIPTITKWHLPCNLIPNAIFANPQLEELSGQLNSVPIIASQVLTTVNLNLTNVAHVQFLPVSVTTLECSGDYHSFIDLFSLPPHLTSLTVTVLQITQEDLASLQDRPLTYLNLEWTTVHNLEFIRKMPLQSLIMVGHPHRRHLQNNDLIHIRAVQSTLTHLNLRNNRITDAGLRHLENIPLRYLNLSSMPLTAASIPSVLTMQLYELNLTCFGYNPNSDAHFNLDTIPWDVIASITTLKILHFGDNYVNNDAYINQLRGAQLTTLNIHGTITDACLDTLLQMPLLHLYVTYSQLSADGIAQLQDMLVTFNH